MKICIYGAGAIGGYLGVQLALAGADVSLVARGAHLAAMRANGLKLLIGDEERVVHPRCTDNPAELGPQDFVIICLKAHSITGVIEAIQPLLGARTRGSSPRSTGFPTGTSTSTATRARDRRLKASTPADGNGGNWARSALSAASSIPRRRSRRPASSAMSMATAFRSAKPPAKKARMSNGSPRCSSRPDCRRRCSIGSVTKSGSSCGAMSASIRSAR